MPITRRARRHPYRGSPLLAPWRGAILLTLLAVLWSGPSPAQPVAVGVNVDNPQWLGPADRDRTLNELRAARVQLIRMPLAPPYEAAADFVLRATAAGIRVTLLVTPWDAEIYPPGAKVRPAMNIPAMFDMLPLSAAEPGRLRTFLKRHLDALEANGVTLAGLEFGNEINWAAFNGDFKLPEQGRVLGLADLRPDGPGAQIAAGYRNYIRLLEVVKEIRDTSRLNTRTPIISAGLADFGPTGGKIDLPAQSVEISATLEYLRGFGLDRLVDAYGIHTYPDTGSTPEARRRGLATSTLVECRPIETGKPCWLTEWGLPNVDQSCPTDDSTRAAVTRQLMADFQTYIDAGSLGGLIYYGWRNDRDPLSMFRCGQLTPSGEAALSARGRNEAAPPR